MFSVGLDVDILVSTVMVTLFFIIGLYAGKFDHFFGPLRLSLFGKIQVNEQSAGNLEISEVDNLISKEYHISDHIKKNTKPYKDDEFGYYLAGLIEGDGYFGDHRFEIAFHKEDIYLAYFIKKQIGYGSVLNLKNKNSVRYVLKHSEGLKRIINLVNGKFLSNYKIDQLLKHNYDKIFNIIILPPVKFDLSSNHWLAGFSDADASFVIQLAKSNIHNSAFNLRLEFKIKQKYPELLNLIQEFLGGNIYLLNSENIYYYKLASFKLTKKIIDYLDVYQLNSSKHIKYLRWRKVYRIVQRKEHLNEIGLRKIRKIQENLRD